MGTSEQAVTNIRQHLAQQQRTYAWLARTSELPYKRVLAEVKHSTRPLSLDTAVACAGALGVDLPSITRAA